MSEYTSPLTVDGIPIIPGLSIPMGFGAKVFFVDPSNGLDGNPGTASAPLKTLSKAHDLCVSGRGDIVILKGGPDASGTTGHTARLTSTLTWSKHNTHLIGACAPAYNKRARITGESTGSTFTPLINVTASGCIFANFSVFQDHGTDSVAVNVTGDRNYFYGVDFLGIGAAAADDANAASLKLNDADENVFERCVIGLDTVARDQANGSLVVTGQSQRNQFRGCLFPMFADGANARFVLLSGSGDIDRWIIFDDCEFHNAIKSTATTIDSVMNVHASVGGTVRVRNSHFYGATEWEAGDSGNVIVDNVNGATTSGKALAETM